MFRRTRVGLVVVTITVAGAMIPTLSAQRGAQPPAAAQAPETMPPLLIQEKWQQIEAAKGVPTSPRRSQGPYWLAGPSAVTNPNIELRLYGTDAKNITVYVHEGRVDLWSGLTMSPVAVLIKHRTSYVDLTGLARVRATLRTGNLHTLHPVIRTAEGALLAGNRVIDTDGQFHQLDVSFANQKWYTLNADFLTVNGAVDKVDLSRVDEVGFVDLAPAGGHGNSGWFNLSHIEVYAKGTPRGTGR